ncbi:hypothetical protein AB0F72_08345 [Actinoplanes sp. NPDC023936]|uniref:hypothetical protein n=1 Tax=Actinoplanes sp. NPDC023936 TaxID=3154910 RepID=UPI0033CA9FB6
MSITVPRAELQAIAERHNTGYCLEGDPTSTWVRALAASVRPDPLTDAGLTSAEAADLDALADRIENQRDNHCIAYSEDPDTGRCECGHDYDDHGGGPGQCEAPLTERTTA